MADDHPLVRILGAWNDPSEEGRTAIAEAALSTSSFVYADPHAPGLITSKADMLAFWTRFHARLPDALLHPTGPLQTHHDVARQAFRLDRAGTPFATGSYVAVLDNTGKVARLIGFLDG